MTDPRIEKVARALCKHEGEEPDKPVSNAGGIQDLGGNAEKYPRWHDYREKAAAFIVMHEAINT